MESEWSGVTKRRFLSHRDIESPAAELPLLRQLNRCRLINLEPEIFDHAERVKASRAFSQSPEAKEENKPRERQLNTFSGSLGGQFAKIQRKAVQSVTGFAVLLRT